MTRVNQPLHCQHDKGKLTLACVSLLCHTLGMDKENLTARAGLAAYFKKLEEFQTKLQGQFPFSSVGACLRCGHWWKRRRITEPTRCPRCRTKYWRTLRTNRQGMRPGT